MPRIAGDPGLGGKLRFALGFRLPPANTEWVRHELIDAGWRGRTVLRHLAVVVPICCLLALLPGPPWLRIMVPLLAILGSVFIVTIYADDIRVADCASMTCPSPTTPTSGHPAH